MKRSHLILALWVASLAPVPALADLFTFNGSGQTGSVQQFTAPTAGEYDIVAYGASGGSGYNGSPGLGAEMGGDFELAAGEVLECTFSPANADYVYEGSREPTGVTLEQGTFHSAKRRTYVC